MHNSLRHTNYFLQLDPGQANQAGMLHSSAAEHHTQQLEAARSRSTVSPRSVYQENGSLSCGSKSDGGEQRCGSILGTGPRFVCAVQRFTCLRSPPSIVCVLEGIEKRSQVMIKGEQPDTDDNQAGYTDGCCNLLSPRRRGLH